MPVKSRRVPVGAGPTLLDEGIRGDEPIVVRNRSATTAVFLGGKDVTTGNGFELGAGAQLSLSARSNEQDGSVANLFAVAAVSGEVDVLSY